MPTTNVLSSVSPILPRILRLSFIPTGALLLLSALVLVSSGDSATAQDIVTVEIFLADKAKMLMHEHIKVALGTAVPPPRYEGFLSTKDLADSWTAPDAPGPYRGEPSATVMKRIMRRRSAIQKRFQLAFLKLRPGSEPPMLFIHIQLLGTRLACDSVSLEGPCSEPPKAL